jgi:hypothetical protein
VSEGTPRDTLFMAEDSSEGEWMKAGRRKVKMELVPINIHYSKAATVIISRIRAMGKLTQHLFRSPGFKWAK